MKKRVIVVYDCPKKKCDKLWVSNGLERAGYEVKIVDWPFMISHLDQRGRLGALLAVLVIILQSIFVMMISRQDDIIFCWLQKSGIYCNRLSRGKRKILSYNWLTPRPKKSTRKLYADALENPCFKAIINSPENKEKNLLAYQAKDIDNMYYIPDVYEEDVTFKPAVYEKENLPETVRETAMKQFNGRYCFMGGRANRDWKLFLEVAQMCPDILFVGVAAASDFKKSEPLPYNVIMKFDTTATEYYDLMSHAYLAVYPLEKQRVSGLINIIKGTLDGLPVLITDMPVTTMYYPKECKDMLFTMGDSADMKKAVVSAYNWTREEYESKISLMQQHVRKNFSPEMASDRIDKIIKLF